jgi:hypothetical protein
MGRHKRGSNAALEPATIESTSCQSRQLRDTLFDSLAGCGKNGFEVSSRASARDLLFARIETKADPSAAQMLRDLGMTKMRFIPQPASGKAACNWFTN